MILGLLNLVSASQHLFNPMHLLRLALQNHTSTHLRLLSQSSSLEQDSLACAKAFDNIMSSDQNYKIQVSLLVTSGFQVNDLGLYDSCLDNEELDYAVVIVRNNRSESYKRRREVKFGLCAPKQCNKNNNSLKFLDNVYKQGLIVSGVILNPEDPEYSFPRVDKEALLSQIGISFYITVFVLLFIVFLSVMGYAVEMSTLGDKVNTKNSLVEAVDEDNPEQILIEKRKKRWALFIYSFSIQRNFEEIFSRSYKSIKDKKFDIFDGLRVIMMSWIILGHCYMLGNEYGQTSPLLKSMALDSFLSYIVVSADYPISFFFFMSGFIGMYGLIKKYQTSNEHAQLYHNDLSSR